MGGTRDVINAFYRKFLKFYGEMNNFPNTSIDKFTKFRYTLL